MVCGRRIAKHYLCVVNGDMRNAMDLQHELLMKSDKGVKVVTESFLEKNPHLRKFVLRSRYAFDLAAALMFAIASPNRRAVLVDTSPTYVVVRVCMITTDWRVVRYSRCSMRRSARRHWCT